jgi:hypothetical protein
MYTFPIIIKMGPKPYISSITSEGVDVYEIVSPYLGPNVDFFNLQLTPSMLGYNQLTIISDDVELNFEKNDKLTTRPH